MQFNKNFGIGMDWQLWKKLSKFFPYMNRVGKGSPPSYTDHGRVLLGHVIKITVTLTRLLSDVTHNLLWDYNQ